MSGIRARDTKPELLVRRFLHANGLRYRLHVKSLPGTPDLVLPRWKTVIFVHGCFWHQHHCSDGHLPDSREAYWRPKLEGNRKRDQRVARKLRRDGWSVITIWECQTTDVEKLRRKLQNCIANRRKAIT